METHQLQLETQQFVLHILTEEVGLSHSAEQGCCMQLKREASLTSFGGGVSVGRGTDLGCKHPRAGSCCEQFPHTLSTSTHGPGEVFVTPINLRHWGPLRGHAHVINTHSPRTLSAPCGRRYTRAGESSHRMTLSFWSHLLFTQHHILCVSFCANHIHRKA